jgi:2-aminoadipate transaminase
VRQVAVERIKQLTDLCTSSLTQAITAELLADTDWFTGHLAHVRAVTAERARAFTTAVADHLPGVACSTPSGGMFCWLTFPDGTDTAELLPRALAAGVGFVPGSAFAVDRPLTAEARCCYASYPPEVVTDAVRRLASVVSAAET